jgi:hypothetical protein
MRVMRPGRRVSTPQLVGWAYAIISHIVDTEQRDAIEAEPDIDCMCGRWLNNLPVGGFRSAAESIIARLGPYDVLPSTLAYAFVVVRGGGKG